MPRTRGVGARPIPAKARCGAPAPARHRLGPSRPPAHKELREPEVRRVVDVEGPLAPHRVHRAVAHVYRREVVGRHATALLLEVGEETVSLQDLELEGMDRVLEL